MKKINIFTSVLSVMALSGLAYAQNSTHSCADSCSDLSKAVVADASTHNSLNKDHMVGHDSEGFFISGDGARLNVGGDLQLRYTYNTNRNIRDNDNNMGFEVPLARIRFSGNLNEAINFMVEGGFDKFNDNAVLLDAYAGFRISENLHFQAGQYQLSFLRENNVALRNQLAVDRSAVTYFFGQGYSQGVQLGYTRGNFSLLGSLSDGFNTANTRIDDTRESDLAVTLRSEYVLVGNAQDFVDFTSRKDDDGSLMVGAAFHYQDGQTQNSMYTYTGDISWKNRGWNAFVAGVGRNTEENNTNFFDSGVIAQAGYRVTEKIEPFVRYDGVFVDSSRNVTNGSNFNFVTGGFNYYIMGNAARLTLDAVYSVNKTFDFGSFGAQNNASLFGSNDSGEISIRGQFQVLF